MISCSISETLTVATENVGKGDNTIIGKCNANKECSPGELRRGAYEAETG